MTRAPALYSNDVRELAAMIASTDVFIGADSGVMHLACSSLTPTIGITVKTNEIEIYELMVLVKILSIQR